MLKHIHIGSSEQYERPDRTGLARASAECLLFFVFLIFPFRGMLLPVLGWARVSSPVRFGVIPRNVVGHKKSFLHSAEWSAIPRNARAAWGRWGGSLRRIPGFALRRRSSLEG